MRITEPHDFQLLGAGFAALSTSLALSAGMTGFAASRHMAAAANLCDLATGHCLLCALSAAMGLAAVLMAVTSLTAFRRARTPRPARSRS